MSLVNKLLKHHISLPQFVGYFVANLFGMAVVLLSVQFYFDVVPLFKSEDSFLSKSLVVVSKHIGAASSLAGTAGAFDTGEESELRDLPYVSDVGEFHSSQYRVLAAMSIGSSQTSGSMQTELFLDAIPDRFVDVPADVWQWSESRGEVPVIVPRSYIAMYNFGYAQSHGLPKVSEGMAGMIGVRIYINSAGHHDVFKCKVVGFSGRINSLLVPMNFMKWSNARYAPDSDDDSPTRLVVKTSSTADPRLARFADVHGYDVASSQLDAGRLTYLLRVVAGGVGFVGLLISVLSFYILMLSIYLLVEKNSFKIESLMLIGYSPKDVAKPYVRLTLIMNAFVLIIAFFAVAAAREYYTCMLTEAYPQVARDFMGEAIVAGGLLFAVVSAVDFACVQHRMKRIWSRRRLSRRLSCKTK